MALPLDPQNPGKPGRMPFFWWRRCGLLVYSLKGFPPMTQGDAMKQIMILTLAVCMAGTAFPRALGQDAEKEAIIRVVASAYMNGIGNSGDVEAIRKGFHPEFNLLGLRDGQLTKLPMAQWIQNVEKQKAEGKFPPKEKVSFKYPMIDIVGTAAAVKIEYFRGSRHAFTDFLSLYKFGDGWKIVGKIYYQHPQPPGP
jgi:hypothetical protein